MGGENVSLERITLGPCCNQSNVEAKWKTLYRSQKSAAVASPNCWVEENAVTSADAGAACTYGLAALPVQGLSRLWGGLTGEWPINSTDGGTTLMLRDITVKGIHGNIGDHLFAVQAVEGTEAVRTRGALAEPLEEWAPLRFCFCEQTGEGWRPETRRANRRTRKFAFLSCSQFHPRRRRRSA